ncbi:MAG: GGDEF domain-containing protein [Anaerolineae bacterium]|jgi:diguanylate cyclase (GGDEF)-like protein|nr:GGDEF domain-containing protein [Anaerolineae bacterium]
MNDSLREKFLTDYRSTSMITEKVSLLINDEILTLITAAPQMIIEHATQLLEEVKEKQFVFFDRNQEGNLYYTLGRAYNVTSNLEEALRCFTTAMYAFQATNNAQMEAKCLSSIGGVYEKSGDSATAYDYTSTALDKAYNTGDRLLEARLMNDLGYTHVGFGEYDKALSYLLPCETYLKEAGDETLMSFVKDSLAQAYFGMGRIDEALEYQKEAVELSRKVNNWYGVASFLGYISTLYAARKEFETGLTCIDEAQQVAEERGFEMEVCNCHKYRAEIFTEQGKYLEALEEYKAGAVIARRIATYRLLYEMYLAMSEVCKKNGDFQSALDYYERFHNTKEKALEEREKQEKRYREVIDQAKNARREADMLQVKNDQLENEINERKLLQQKLENLAKTDPLTRLLNRRSFFTQAALVYERSRRASQTFSLILFDVDHFKEINDTYGHQAGDQILAKVGERMRHKAPDGALTCRFGGEEFIILLPDTDSKEAQSFASDLKDEINRPINTSEKPIQVSASFGISTFDPSEAVNLDKLIERADDAMYHSKENGRNRITVSSDHSGSGVLNYSRLGLQSIFTTGNRTKKKK